MQKAPHITQFQTPESYYIYDVNSNEIIRVSSIMHNIFARLGKIPTAKIVDKLSTKYPKEHIVSCLSLIEKQQNENKLFSTSIPSCLSFPKTPEQIKDRINNKMRYLILEVTQSCNLKCRHCSYSGNFNFERTHSSKMMSFEIGKKAIDLYMDCSKSRSEHTIGFYGGEPLLNFELIAKLVDYIKGHYVDKVKFTVTTNGTLLDKNKIKFFVENDFSLLISLDGPDKIHDRMRIYPNGKGTYNSIYNNIYYLKINYPDFYKEQVNFSTVIFSLKELNKIYAHLTSSKIATNKSPRMSFVNTVDSNLIQKRIINISADEPIYFKELANRCVNQVISGNRPDPIMDVVFDKFKIIHKRPLTQLTDKPYPNGICIPGGPRIFCTAGGNLTLCERIPDKVFIGNVETGLNYTAIFKLINDYIEASSQDCVQCWAIRFCKACYVQVYRNKVSLEKKRKYCDMTRTSLKRALSMYCTALEKNTHAFDYIASIDHRRID